MNVTEYLKKALEHNSKPGLPAQGAGVKSLNDIFVSPELQPYSGPLQLLPAELDPTSPIDNPDRLPPVGGDMPFVTVLVDNPRSRWIIQGQPGSGKTVLFQRLIMHYATDPSNIDSEHPTIPIPLTGRFFASFIHKENGMESNGEPRLWSFIDYMLRWLGGGKGSPELLNEFMLAAREGRIVLFVDGLDERSSEGGHNLLADVLEFEQHYQQCRYFLFERILVDQVGPVPEGWQALRLKSFDRERTLRLIERWKPYTGGHGVLRNAGAMDALPDTLQRFTRNPLICTLMIRYYKGASKGGLTDLIRILVDAIAFHATNDNLRGIDIEDVFEILSEFALRLRQSQSGASVPDLRTIIETHLAQFEYASEDRPRAIARIRRSLMHRFLESPNGTDFSRSFRLTVLQDFLAARYLSRHHSLQESFVTSSQPLEPAWRNVAILTANIERRRGKDTVTQFVRNMRNIPLPTRVGREKIQDNLLTYRLRLVIRCLSETGMPYETRKTYWAEVVKEVCEKPYLARFYTHSIGRMTSDLNNEQREEFARQLDGLFESRDAYRQRAATYLLTSIDCEAGRGRIITAVQEMLRDNDHFAGELLDELGSIEGNTDLYLALTQYIQMDSAGLPLARKAAFVLLQSWKHIPEDHQQNIRDAMFAVLVDQNRDWVIRTFAGRVLAIGDEARLNQVLKRYYERPPQPLDRGIAVKLWGEMQKSDAHEYILQTAGNTAEHFDVRAKAIISLAQFPNRAYGNQQIRDLLVGILVDGVQGDTDWLVWMAAVSLIGRLELREHEDNMLECNNQLDIITRSGTIREFCFALSALGGTRCLDALRNWFSQLLQSHELKGTSKHESLQDALKYCAGGLIRWSGDKEERWQVIEKLNRYGKDNSWILPMLPATAASEFRRNPSREKDCLEILKPLLSEADDNTIYATARAIDFIELGPQGI